MSSVTSLALPRPTRNPSTRSGRVAASISTIPSRRRRLGVIGLRPMIPNNPRDAGEADLVRHLLGIYPRELHEQVRLLRACGMTYTPRYTWGRRILTAYAGGTAVPGW